MGIDTKVINKNLLSYTKEIFEHKQGDSVIQNSHVTLFFSFDITNSTVFKANNKGKWASSISAILNQIISEFANSPTSGYQFWKILGDEVIYTKEIKNIDEIIFVLEEISRILGKLNREIIEGVICDINDETSLSIKATAWIADISNDCSLTHNIYSEFKVNDNRKQKDYLGSDIDTGFRISKYCRTNRLVISFQIASLICLHHRLRPHIHKLNIVGYRSLKGVWDTAHYPIIMYHSNTEVSFLDSIEERYYYIETIFKDYLETYKVRFYDAYKGYVSYEDQAIHCLLAQFNITDKVEKLISVIEKETESYHHVVREFEKVHNTLVLYKIEDDKKMYLLFKNKDGNFDFSSNTMYHLPFSFLYDLKELYMKLYHCQFEFVFDASYLNHIPKIITTYKYFDENKELFGSVYLGELISLHNSIENEFNQEYTFLSEQEIYENLDDYSSLFKEIFIKLHKFNEGKI